MSLTQDYLKGLDGFLDKDAKIDERSDAALDMFNALRQIQRRADGKTEEHALIRHLCSAARIDAVFALALRCADALLASDGSAVPEITQASVLEPSGDFTEGSCMTSLLLLTMVMKVFQLPINLKCGVTALERQGTANLVRVCAAAVSVAERCNEIGAPRITSNLCMNAANLLSTVAICCRWETFTGLVRAGTFPLFLRLLHPSHMHLEDPSACGDVVTSAHTGILLMVSRVCDACLPPNTQAEARAILADIAQLPFYPSAIRAMLAGDAYKQMEPMKSQALLYSERPDELVVQHGGWQQLQADPPLLQRAIAMYRAIARSPPKADPSQAAELSAIALCKQRLLERCASGAPWVALRSGSQDVQNVRGQIKVQLRNTEIRVCEACKAVSGNSCALQRCGRCRVTFYCGPACQKAHWKTHKVTCVAQKLS